MPHHRILKLYVVTSLRNGGGGGGGGGDDDDDLTSVISAHLNL
jgi:hypothetical protein